MTEIGSIKELVRSHYHGSTPNSTAARFSMFVWFFIIISRFSRNIPAGPHVRMPWQGMPFCITFVYCWVFFAKSPLNSLSNATAPNWSAPISKIYVPSHWSSCVLGHCCCGTCATCQACRIARMPSGNEPASGRLSQFGKPY